MFLYNYNTGRDIVNTFGEKKDLKTRKILFNSAYPTSETAQLNGFLKTVSQCAKQELTQGMDQQAVPFGNVEVYTQGICHLRKNKPEFFSDFQLTYRIEGVREEHEKQVSDLILDIHAKYSSMIYRATFIAPVTYTLLINGELYTTSSNDFLPAW